MIDNVQRAARRRYLGSSDAAAVCGRDPWRNAADVWAEKSGKLAPAVDDPNPALELGRYLEGGILDWTANHLGVPIARDQWFTHPNGVCISNLDGLVLAAEPRAIVEAKVSGLLGPPRFLDDFGDAETDAIPQHVLIQVHHQFFCLRADPAYADVELAYVPVLLVHRGFVLFRVQRSPELCDALLDLELRFWRDHVLADVAPPDEPPALETLKRFVREPSKTVAIAPELVRDWQAAKATKKIAETEEQEGLRAVLVALGDAEAGTAGELTVTYLEQTRAAYTAPATTFRVARLKAPPKPRTRRE